MEVTQTNINNNIHLLSFQKHKDLVYTFLRFQEHYESPYFRWMVFSLDEYMQRYIKNSTWGQETWEFTYCDDRIWFNIPSSTLSAFYQWLFSPLSKKERRLLKQFAHKKDEKFYIIGISSETEDVENILRHETAHWLFYSDFNYRKEVLDVLAWFDVEILKEELRNSWWYHENVLLDEINAYIVDWDNNLDGEVPTDLSSKLEWLYDKYSKINNIILPSTS